MDFLNYETIGLLFAVGLFAGWVDAIAGGGGLITIPALFSVGLTPAQALATNKLQGTFGTMTATLNFLKQGHLKVKEIWPMILLTFIGAAAGTILVQNLDPAFLVDFIPFLLMAVAAYFLFQPKIGEDDRQQKLGLWGFSFTIGFGVGFYDGFFGPGTGSFFALGFVTLMGFNLLKATAHTKVLNFTSNVASLAFFIMGGQVMWIAGLIMGMGQIIGSFAGSHMTMKHGSKIVRPLLIVVSIAITIKLIYSNDQHILHQWIAGLIS